MTDHVNWLFTATPEPYHLLLFFLLNFIFSLIIAAVLLPLLSKYLPRHKLGFFCWMVALGSFIPIFGFLILIASISLLRHYGDFTTDVIIKTFPELTYTDEKIINVGAYGVGWAKIRLESTQFPKRVREEALISVNKTINRETNEFNRKLLSDTTDELRLFAFSFLEKQQDAINNNISEVLKKYDRSQGMEKAQMEKYLAALYWELTYLNLAETEFRQLIINRCLFFLRRALKVLDKDYSLWCLLAQVYKNTHEIEKSIEALETADSLGAPPTRVLPYLAELSFIQGNYNDVRRYLCSNISNKDMLQLKMLFLYWCKR